jgi:hypothetical protein
LLLPSSSYIFSSSSTRYIYIYIYGRIYIVTPHYSNTIVVYYYNLRPLRLNKVYIAPCFVMSFSSVCFTASRGPSSGVPTRVMEQIRYTQDL